MIERTLVLIKPEGVKRNLIGKIITRFEDAGLKIVGMKQSWIKKDFAKKHYTESISKKHGEKVREILLDYITEGPVIAMVIEGVEAIENVRKIVGGTEPKSAPPGTIRGDFAHTSWGYTRKNEKAIKNLMHASEDKKDAEKEIKLWFKPEELHSYETIQDLLM
jgi:nucleoside-diphosphate kinase